MPGHEQRRKPSSGMLLVLGGRLLQSTKPMCNGPALAGSGKPDWLPTSVPRVNPPARPPLPNSPHCQAAPVKPHPPLLKVKRLLTCLHVRRLLHRQLPGKVQAVLTDGTATTLLTSTMWRISEAYFTTRARWWPCLAVQGSDEHLMAVVSECGRCRWCTPCLLICTRSGESPRSKPEAPCQMPST